MLERRQLQLDLLALGLLASTLFLALSLVTYDAGDPPTSSVFPAYDQVHNLCGVAGAWLASILFNTLGVAAYFLLVTLVVIDALVLSRRTVAEPTLRACGWLLMLVSLPTLAALAISGFSPGPVIGPGGYVGALGRALLEQHFAIAEQAEQLRIEPGVDRPVRADHKNR